MNKNSKLIQNRRGFARGIFNDTLGLGVILTPGTEAIRCFCIIVDSAIFVPASAQTNL